MNRGEVGATPAARIYTVVDASLPTGGKVAQSVHAALAYALLFPRELKEWEAASNTLVCLESDDLPKIERRMRDQGLKVAAFHEPDLGGQLTAVAVGPFGGRSLSSLRLAR